MKQTRTVTKMLFGAALAGALLLAVPNRAQAQVSFGVAVGNYPPPPPHPSYGYDNAYAYNNGYYADSAAYYEQQRCLREQHERWEAEQREHWRPEQWEHRDGWRDRDRHHDDFDDR